MTTTRPGTRIFFQREWIIRAPYMYRYLEREWVDAFFRDGTLRIGSFRSFAKHPDEILRDTGEGQGFVSNIASGDGQQVTALIRDGGDSYVMSGSTVYEDGKFGKDSGFRISDPTAFANAVSSQIPGLYRGLEGLCHYISKRAVRRDIGHITIDSLKRDAATSNDISFEKLSAAIDRIAGDDLFFVKLDTYRNDFEYRLIWQSPSHQEPELFIKCPEAREVCTHFDDLKQSLEYEK